MGSIIEDDLKKLSNNEHSIISLSKKINNKSKKIKNSYKGLPTCDTIAVSITDYINTRNMYLKESKTVFDIIEYNNTASLNTLDYLESPVWDENNYENETSINDLALINSPSKGEQRVNRNNILSINYPDIIQEELSKSKFSSLNNILKT